MDPASDLASLSAGALLEATIAAQRRASDPRRSVWARANAGAGKTKVLVDRIARLLLDGAEPGRILAITYTRAAAAEMQTRLFAQLGRWTVAPEEVLRAELRALDPALQLDGARLRAARALFARALETPGGLKVLTIHAFCQGILRRFPLEAGVPPGFEVAQGALEDLLRTRAWSDARRAAPAAFEFLAGLTSGAGDREQVMAAAALVQAPDGLLQDPQALAGALAAAIGLPADRIGQDPQALRREALASLIDLFRAAQPVLATGSDREVSTASRLAASLAAWDAGRHLEAVDEAMGLILTGAGGVRAASIATKTSSGHPAVVALTGTFSKEDGYSGPLGRLAEAERTARLVELLEASVALSQAAGAWRTALARAKAALGLLDFDDLLDRTAALLSAGPGAAQWVLYKLDQGIDHVLLDEAQDTSPRQWDLLAPLLEALEEGAGGRARTRFVVGDEKQSIYSFQGARPERFLAEETAFTAAQPHPDAPPRERVRFELSFRTGQTILDAVDHVWAICGPDAAAPAAGRDGTTAGPAPEVKFAVPRHHFARRTGTPGVVELWPLTRHPGKPPERPAWDMPLDVESEASARNKLAERVAAEIAARLAAGEAVFDRHGDTEVPRPVEPGDIMVLVQSRGPLFHQIIRRLKARRIPVAGADRIRLREDVGVQDLLALARFALCPGDDFNLACVLKGAFCGLVDDDTALFPLAHDRGTASLWSRLQARTDPTFAPVAAFLADLVPLAGALAPYDFLATVLEQPLPDGRTGWRALVERLGREVREPVEALLGRALDHGRTGQPGLAAFLAAIEATDPDVKRELDQGGSGVRVMTVHGAKGLEAPVVILPDTTSNGRTATSRLFPEPASGAVIWAAGMASLTGGLQEAVAAARAAVRAERARLLYVAMTRARDRLILAGAWSGRGPEDSASARGYAVDTWYDWLVRGLAALPGGTTRLIDPDGQGGEAVARSWGNPQPAAAATAATLPAPPRPTGAAGRAGAPAAAGAPVPDWVHRNAPPARAPARRIAPSALAPDGEAGPPAVTPAQAGATARLLRGALVHQLLQRLPDVPRDRRAAAGSAILGRAGAGLAPALRDTLLAEVLAVLDDPHLAPLFGAGSRPEVAVTGTGPGLPPGLTVAGTVDRLVVRDGAVLVVDYKTNRVPPACPDDVSPAHLAQMAAYRAVLQAAWPDHAVRCALVWTEGPVLMALPDRLLDRALRDLSQRDGRPG